MRPHRWLPAAALIVWIALGGAGPARAQYIEPLPRAPGVAPPPLDPARQAEEARRLGIPAVEALALEVEGTLDGAAVGSRSASRAPIRRGALRVIVVPALFSDSPEPHVAAADIESTLFGSEGRTVTTFYAEASRGLLSVDGRVAQWVRTPVSLADAAGELDGHGWFGPDLGAWVVAAIRAADREIDFGAFDNDGADGVPNSGDDDGRVDALVVEYLEPAGSCGGPGPWPHLSTTRTGTENGQPLRTDDPRPDGTPVIVDAYIAESATDCSGRGTQTIEVMSHELGHVLGLPDYYRSVGGGGAETRHWTVGCFALMAAGGWGCGDGPTTTGFGPTHFSPLSLMKLGWAEPIRVERAEDREVVLEPVRTSGQVLVVPLAPGGPEAFHLEYRRREGFDADLPAEGVLVYHHDAFDGRRPVAPGEPPAYGYHLVEADDDDGLRRLLSEGGDRGRASDVFAVDGGPAALDASTAPSTRGHDGEPTTLTIHEIRVEGDRARVRLTVGSGMRLLPRIAPGIVTALQPLEGSYEIAGGTPPYAVRVSPATGLPVGVETSLDEGVLRLRGVPRQAGRFPLVLAVADAGGAQAQRQILVQVRDLSLDPVRVVEEILGAGSGALAAEEAEYLDLSGNGNGFLDVGDLRARFRREELR